MVVTNALGVAFAAALLSASDAGVTFVFPEDGATNALEWTKLAPASQEAIVEAMQFAPVPPALASTFRQAREDSLRLAALEADNRLVPTVAARRRDSLRKSFIRRCREHGLSETRIRLLLKRL